MTAPRRVLPLATYMIARRVTQQQSFLRPSKLTNEVVSYCVATAAEHTGVDIHVMCVMSNHWHLVVTDPDARLPEFLERAHRAIAKCLNAAMGRWENFWSSDKTSVVQLLTEQDVLDKMAYVLANPTAAGLVRSPDEWPGVITRRLGEQLDVAMPDVYFEQAEDCGENVLTFTRPPIFPELSDDELNERLAIAVASRVRAAHARMRADGRTFAGLRAVLSEPPTSRPKAAAPRRRLNPRIAAAVPSIRIAAIDALKRFLLAYRAALEAWRNGERDRLFPAGTYALRVRAGVHCVPLVPI